MKKLALLVLVLALITTGVFAGGRGGAQQGPIVVQLALENHPGEPYTEAIFYWANLINERSRGTMVAEVFPSSQLGTKDQLMDMMLAGMGVITLADGGWFGDRGAPDFGITMGPYFFETWNQAWNLVESDWWREQSRILENRGLKELASNWIYGDRHTLTTRPIRNLEDFRGLKLRVPNNLMQVRGTEVLGASPTPLPLGEVYTALQQGVVDGVENPLAVLRGGRFYEVAKYLSLTAHIRLITTWFTSTEWFNNLPRELQEMLIETGRLAGEENNRLVARSDEETLAYFRSQGVEIINIDLAPLQAAAQAFYSLPDVVGRWSPGTVERATRAKSGPRR